MALILNSNKAEQLKLVAAAATFTYVGSTFANDIVHALHRTAAGRAAYKWVHKNPVSARCVLLAGTGALALAWPSTVAKIVGYIGGVGAGKDSGFSMRGGASGGTSGFVGIIQSATAGRAAGVLIMRKVGAAITGFFSVTGVVAWQWRRVMHFISSVRRKTSEKIRERKDKDRESSSSGSSSKDRKDKGSSSSRRDRLFSPPPPPPPHHEVEVSDGESIHSKRSTSSRSEKKHRKHRK
ncbi:hypothetical protein F5B20DRAFT_110506 [Whalleya microplaca]|nr:hypothetical protein F5B20DRAFT_110506 [Whalleya microplaca]